MVNCLKIIPHYNLKTNSKNVIHNQIYSNHEQSNAIIWHLPYFGIVAARGAIRVILMY